MKRSIAILVALVSLTVIPAMAQFTEMGFEVGAAAGVAMDNNSADEPKPGFHVRAVLAYPILNPLQVEFNYAYSELLAKDLYTVMAPLDIRLRLCPFHTKSVVPYLYGGIGMLNWSVQEHPAVVDPEAERTGWTGYAPVGVGVEWLFDEYLSAELQGGFNQSFTKDLNPNLEDANDSFISVLAGLRVRAGNPNKDTDGDGLTDREEKRLGTDWRNPDTDGDGLQDGAEYLTHHTDPLKADTDGDGLSDGAEVNEHMTDPLKADTDGDGLNDGAEVNEHKTDPLKADTDGDGLNDGAEVTDHKTDPLKADTDGDTLSDGAEINTHKTDALKKDTDDGSVDDGREVTRGSNPLAAGDDKPKIVLEIDKPIALEGIVFKTGSSEIQPESEKILNDAYETLRDNPEIIVLIGGHTDNTGSKSKNMQLSQARAESVKAWLVQKGIPAERMQTKGFGPDRPTATNDTPEGRQKNRRIEFTRTK